MTEMSLTLLVNEISSNYEAEEIFVTKPSGHFPNRDAIISIIKDVRSLIFPGYFAGEVLEGVGAANYVAEQLMRIRNALRTQVREALLFRDGTALARDAIERRTDEICATFMAELPNIQELLFKDVQAAFDGDPAAQSKQEIILAYPGLFAIFVYRIAHVLYTEKVPLIPRLMTEYAHSKTASTSTQAPPSASTSSSTTPRASLSARPPPSVRTSRSTRASPWARSPHARASSSPE